MANMVTTAAVDEPHSQNPSDGKKPGSSGKGSNEQISTHLQSTLLEARKRYIANNPASCALHQEALNFLPGGNSRTVLFSAPFPLSMASGHDYMLIDVDGHKYVDLVGEFSAGLYGHSQATIQEAIRSTLDDTGLNLGAHTRYEVEYAALLCARFKLETVRFCNSGTEANIHALMAARFSTGKRKIIAFTGGYHGGVLSFRNKPAANTINEMDFLMVDYNNTEAAITAIEQNLDVGAVIIEAMQGASGNILGQDGFLHAIQTSCQKVGAVFILDEVLTSRLAPGGLQSTIGLQPDITTLGKYLGGGLAFGAFGGRRSIMDIFDPRVSKGLSHSGTFNNNTLTMRAGFAGLSRVYTPEITIAFNSRGEALLKRLRQLCKGTRCSWTGRGSLLYAHFTKTERSDIKSIIDLEEDEHLKEIFWLEMLEFGFWITRRGSVSIILGTPQSELDRFYDCVAQFLLQHQDIVSVPRTRI